MQFMIIVKSGASCEAGQTPSQEVITAVGNYTQELRRAGVLVELSRLEPGTKAARIQFSAGKTLVIDGPFAETRELIGGYWIIAVNSKEEAIEWAKRVPPRVGEDTAIEVRRFLDVEYFVPSGALSATAESARRA